MFFILSKVLYFLLQPLNWVILCLVCAVWPGRPRRRRRFSWAALVLALFFSNHFLVNLAYRAYEPPARAVRTLTAPYDVGIVLGGYSYTHIATPADRHNFNEAAARLTQAVELYKLGKIRRILVTGGTGNLVSRQYNEGREIVRFLTRLGVPRDSILVEDASRNTRENAVNTARLLANRPAGERYLLLTSAFHLPRAAACFRAVGLPFDGYATHYIGERVRYVPSSTLVPDRLGFFRWELLIKEWVGYAVYRLRGWTA